MTECGKDWVCRALLPHLSHNLGNAWVEPGICAHACVNVCVCALEGLRPPGMGYMRAKSQKGWKGEVSFQVLLPVKIQN